MVTKKYRNSKSKTKKTTLTSSSTKLLAEFQKEITIVFFEMLLLIKLFHWKTYSYAIHKATDELYAKLNTNMDSFIEILLGKNGSRIDLTQTHTIKLMDLTSPKLLRKEINLYKAYLVGLNKNKAMLTMANTDLFNIRDTLLGDLNQFLYLLTFN